MNLCIVIPCYNEAERIEKTIHEYQSFFSNKAGLQTTLLIVLNGCTDKSSTLVARLAEQYTPFVTSMQTDQKGKGHAIRAGFEKALSSDFDLIGFVDADMATRPYYFFELVQNIHDCSGVIASRYMPGSKIYPARPRIKRWGSRLIYEFLIRTLLGISYYDYQCGAKLFTRALIQKTITHMTVQQWAFDIELLYLAYQYGFTIKELPTVWYDQAGSKMTLRAGVGMLVIIFKIWLRHRTQRKQLHD